MNITTAHWHRKSEPENGSVKQWHTENEWRKPAQQLPHILRRTLNFHHRGIEMVDGNACTYIHPLCGRKSNFRFALDYGSQHICVYNCVATQCMYSLPLIYVYCIRNFNCEREKVHPTASERIRRRRRVREKQLNLNHVIGVLWVRHWAIRIVTLANRFQFVCQ